jgi:thiol:disulfide interchange protein
MRAMPFNGTLIFLVLLLSSFYNYPISGHQNIPRKEKETDTLNWLSFNEGHSKAIKEDKILLINVSTDWCYPCKMMNDLHILFF